MKRSPAYLALYFLAVALPSAPVVQRYLGVGGAIAYIVGVGFVVAILPLVFSWVPGRISNRAAIALGAVALIAIIAAFVVIYPRVNTHDPGTGSDRDDALNVGVEELVHGRYPYHAKTYLDAPISPGPGAIIQSIPFWLLGNAAYQNFFWLPAFVIVAARLLNDLKLAIGVTLMTIFLSPGLVGLEVMTGGDFFANSLYVLTATMVLILAARKSMLGALAAGALLGLLLSSRAVYVFTVPVVLAHLWRESNWKRAALAGLTVLVVAVATSLPFYLHAPDKFGPLAAQNKFEDFKDVLPHANVIAVATTSLLAIGLAMCLLFKRETAVERAMGACAIVLIYPAALGMVLDCIKERRLTFNFGGWASCGTMFAAMAIAAISGHRGAASARCAADRPDCS